ncbi:uncharacterized protein BcabD6B2_46560 [Babesia caballi]|uniref:Uncharacterized protein n=1 Tax=Babesia caballi TaxID=5871 RepID=A0AAV4LYC9_BABCB|nr:hypothetical protein BcabD6B2_46560 [Babesia caballi]
MGVVLQNCDAVEALLQLRTESGVLPHLHGSALREDLLVGRVLRKQQRVVHAYHLLLLGEGLAGVAQRLDGVGGVAGREAEVAGAVDERAHEIEDSSPVGSRGSCRAGKGQVRAGGAQVEVDVLEDPGQGRRARAGGDTLLRVEQKQAVTTRLQGHAGPASAREDVLRVGAARTDAGAEVDVRAGSCISQLKLKHANGGERTQGAERARRRRDGEPAERCVPGPARALHGDAGGGGGQVGRALHGEADAAHQDAARAAEELRDVDGAAPQTVGRLLRRGRGGLRGRGARAAAAARAEGDAAGEGSRGGSQTALHGGAGAGRAGVPRQELAAGGDQGLSADAGAHPPDGHVAAGGGDGAGGAAGAARARAQEPDGRPPLRQGLLLLREGFRAGRAVLRDAAPPDERVQEGVPPPRADDAGGLFQLRHAEPGAPQVVLLGLDAAGQGAVSGLHQLERAARALPLLLREDPGRAAGVLPGLQQAHAGDPEGAAVRQGGVRLQARGDEDVRDRRAAHGGRAQQEHLHQPGDEAEPAGLRGRGPRRHERGPRGLHGRVRQQPGAV